MYIYVLVNMCKASDKCLMRDMGNKYSKNWRRERSSKAFIQLSTSMLPKFVSTYQISLLF